MGSSLHRFLLHGLSADQLEFRQFVTREPAMLAVLPVHAIAREQVELAGRHGPVLAGREVEVLHSHGERITPRPEAAQFAVAGAFPSPSSALPKRPMTNSAAVS